MKRELDRVSTRAYPRNGLGIAGDVRSEGGGEHVAILALLIDTYKRYGIDPKRTTSATQRMVRRAQRRLLSVV